jgi:H+-translocating NAD(P) transhydrogenase subunit alpha
VSEDFQRREHEHLHRLVSEADVVVTTAQIPGRPAPLLITAEMVAAMRAGSVIVDLAAESGGNCALTEAGRDVRHNGVLVLGPTNLPATMPFHASQMYSRNITALLLHLLRDGELRLDLEDEITRGCAVAVEGRVLTRA